MSKSLKIHLNRKIMKNKSKIQHYSSKQFRWAHDWIYWNEMFCMLKTLKPKRANIVNISKRTNRWKNVDETKDDVIHRQNTKLKLLGLLPQGGSRCCDGRRFFVDSNERQNDADEGENDRQKQLDGLRKNDEHQKTQIVLRSAGQTQRREFIRFNL